jgi:hypothetical protein
MVVAMIRGKFNFSGAPALQKGKSNVTVTCTHFLVFQLHGYVVKAPSLLFQVIVIFQCTKFWIGKDVEGSNCGLLSEIILALYLELLGKNNTQFIKDMEDQNTLMISHISGKNVKLPYSASIDSRLITRFIFLMRTSALRLAMSICSQPIYVITFFIADLKPRKYISFSSVHPDP